VAQRSTTPDPSLSKEGNYAAIFMPSGEPKDRESFARNGTGMPSPRHATPGACRPTFVASTFFLTRKPACDSLYLLSQEGSGRPRQAREGQGWWSGKVRGNEPSRGKRVQKCKRIVF